MKKSQSKTDLVKYLHGCAFSPVSSTFKTAIGKDNFVTLPGIDNIHVDKLVRPTVPTEKGHLDQERQGLKSSKQQVKLEDAHEDAFTTQSLPKTREMGIAITALKSTTYSDLPR